MITREFGDGGYAAGCANAPPPLHVYDTESERANWYPYERPYFRAVNPGPVAVLIPQPAGNALGDDPTDPSAQTYRRYTTTGMIGRLHDGNG